VAIKACSTPFSLHTIDFRSPIMSLHLQIINILLLIVISQVISHYFTSSVERNHGCSDLLSVEIHIMKLRDVGGVFMKDTLVGKFERMS